MLITDRINMMVDPKSQELFRRTGRIRNRFSNINYRQDKHDGRSKITGIV